MSNHKPPLRKSPDAPALWDNLRHEVEHTIIDPRAQPYYDATTLDLALEIAMEKVEEWSYAGDPHGYAHDRPVLLRLVKAVLYGT